MVGRFLHCHVSFQGGISCYEQDMFQENVQDVLQEFKDFDSLNGY